jgi:hypothetical protein
MPLRTSTLRGERFRLTKTEVTELRSPLAELGLNPQASMGGAQVLALMSLDIATKLSTTHPGEKQRLLDSLAKFNQTQ